MLLVSLLRYVTLINIIYLLLVNVTGAAQSFNGCFIASQKKVTVSLLLLIKKLSLFLRLPVCRRSSFLTGEGWERVGEEPNHTTAIKLGPL